MASINTFLNLIDNISNPLMGIQSSLDTTTRAFEDIGAAANDVFSTADFGGIYDDVNTTNYGLNQIANQLDSTTDSQNSLNTAIGKMSIADFSGVYADVTTTNYGLNQMASRLDNATIKQNGLNTAIDNMSMSAPLQHATNALHLMVESMVDMQDATNNAFNSSTIEGMRNELNSANAAMLQIAETANATTRNQNQLNQSVDKTDDYIRDNIDRQEQFSDTINSSVLSANNLNSTFSNLMQSVGVMTLINKAVNMVTSSFDSAISRYDTLNNFPQMLQQMGYSAEEAAASTQRLSDGITGLPTALDDMTGYVSQFEVITKNLNYATESTVALNNAILAGGKSAEVAGRATENYLTMFGSGTVDAQHWKSLANDMTYALSEVAEAFGYTSVVAGGDFYTALQNGDVTMTEFNNKLIELSNATGGFAEVAQTATGGIGTAWENLGTAVTRGVTTVIGAFDDMLADAGLASVADTINNIKNSISNFFDGVAMRVAALSPIVTGVVNALQSVGAWISENWQGIMIAASAAVGIFAVKMAMAASATIAANMPLIMMTGIALAVGLALQKIGVTADEVAGVVGGVIGTLVAVVYNQFVTMWNFIALFVNFFGNAFNDPIGAIKVLFIGLAEHIMNVMYDALSFVETLINKIPGVQVDITSGVGNLRDSLADAAQRAKDEMEWVEYVQQKTYWDYDNAFNSGYTVGTNLVTGIGDALSNLENALNLDYDPNDYLADTGLDDTLTTGTSEADYLSNIDDNTADIATAVLDTSDAQLKYLKEIAERLAISESTPVVVNMNVENNVSSGSSDNIDGILASITDGLSEAMAISAEGVHV